MPKILSYTPAWLSKPSQGHDIFTRSQSKSTDNSSLSASISRKNFKKDASPGPRRTIAKRGTEVFVAVGKEIRWADLVYLKETFEEKQDQKHKPWASRGRDIDIEDEESVESEDEYAHGFRVGHLYTICYPFLMSLDTQSSRCR
jgi:nucleoporin NUP82